MKRLKNFTTKQQLEELGIRVELTESGEINVYRDNKQLNRYDFATVHEYGKTKTYCGYGIYLGKEVIDGKTKYKYKSLLEHVASYLWFKGDIPIDKLSFDIDHIDNNPFNNRPENLELKSRKDNLAKRGIVKNQYIADLSDEEVLKRRHDKEETRVARNCKYEYIREINDMIFSYKCAAQAMGKPEYYSKWHKYSKLIKTVRKMKFNKDNYKQLAEEINGLSYLIETEDE